MCHNMSREILKIYILKWDITIMSSTYIIIRSTPHCVPDTHNVFEENFLVPFFDAILSVTSYLPQKVKVEIELKDIVGSSST